MTDEQFAEQDAVRERLDVQESDQRASAEKAKAFAVNITYGNSTKFRGMTQEQIYKVLTGNHWPR